MSEAVFEATESEAYPGEGESEAIPGEAVYGGEAASEAAPEAEDARSDAYWRARWQQIMRDRRAQALQRRPPSAPMPSAPPGRAAVTAPSQRQAMTAVSNLALDTKVETASIRRKVDQSTQTDDWNMYIAMITGLIAQGLDTFEPNLGNHPNIRAAVRLGPYAFLRRKKTERGFEGLVTHPAFLTAAGAVAILGAGHFINAPRGVRKININDPGTLSPGDTGTLAGVAVDGSGQPLTDVALTWNSPNSNVLTVIPSTGAYTAGRTTGTVFVTATGGGVTDGIFVTVSSD